jgi:hypothetical protein
MQCATTSDRIDAFGVQESSARSHRPEQILDGNKMKQWTDRRILDLFGIELPIILAPMAGPGTVALTIAVSDAGDWGLSRAHN